MQTVAFHTLGCKVNQYDTQAMLEAFLAEGYKQVPFEAAADVYVINTCTVTGTGDKKSMQSVRRALRQNPQAAIVVAGCLAQRSGEALLLPGVRLVLGTQRRAEVVALLHRALEAGEALVAVDTLTAATFERLAVTAHEGHTRAVLKVQEGCDRHCSYCIIPSVRGPIRSRPLADLREEARRLGEAGFLELVFTGIHLSSYGRDLDHEHGEITLLAAIEAVHDAPGVRRIRLGSLEPRIITPGFVQALRAFPKVCPHFHLALQSGSDTVLARMRRRYTAAQFLEACTMLREAFPLCAITTDVMTGFPGETEEEFAQTQRTVAQAAFARMHVFPYSERGGTLAAHMPNAVPKALREARARTLIDQGNALEQAYLRSLIGSEQEVLFEEAADKATETADCMGYAPQYVTVRVPGGTIGQILRVRLTELCGNEILGSLV